MLDSNDLAMVFFMKCRFSAKWEQIHWFRLEHPIADQCFHWPAATIHSNGFFWISTEYLDRNRNISMDHNEFYWKTESNLTWPTILHKTWNQSYFLINSHWIDHETRMSKNHRKKTKLAIWFCLAQNMRHENLTKMNKITLRE